LPPFFVIAGLASDIDGSVDRTAAAENLAPGLIEPAVVEGLDRFGL
jgi:hypothetical protein